jgi:copper transport protein
MLFGYLLRRANDRELRAILPIWSGWATLAVAVLATAGVSQALVQIGSVKALLGTTYGRLVIVKVGLLGLVLAVAWFSRRLVRAGWQPEPVIEDGAAPTGRARTATAELTKAEVAVAAPAGRLRRSVLAELAVVSVVLVVSSALVQTTPARNAVAGAQQAGPYDGTLTSGLYLLDVSIDPARAGSNSLHLFAFTPDRKDITIREWHASAALPAQGIEPIDITLLPVTASHAIGEVTLPVAGDWVFSFTLRTTDIDEATVTQNVPIG